MGSTPRWQVGHCHRALISLCIFAFSLKFVQVCFGFALNIARFSRDERENITRFSRASDLVRVCDDCATVCVVYCETFAR